MFACLKSNDWKYCLLIYCERKTLLADRKGTAYKQANGANVILLMFKYVYELNPGKYLGGFFYLETASAHS